MTKVEFINNVTRSFHKVGFQLKKHSPEILVVTGVVGVVASAVMACKATTKVNAILEEAKENVDGIHQVLDTPALREKYAEKYGEEYTDELGKKDLAHVYVKTGWNFAKLYGPSVLLGAASLACILTSHNIIRKRNLAIAAAYATVDQGFKDYRGRVIERFGKELDKELRYDIKTKEIEETIVNEDGTAQTVKETVRTIDATKYSGYARCFDETCYGWERDSETNLWFLMRQQDWANEKLKAQGYLFLNDVYKMLGMQPTATGQQVGWIYDEKNPIGDNYIDFGIHDLYDKQKRLFVNGYEKSIWIDFNVDGCILDYLP
jgi:hypothetical protein